MRQIFKGGLILIAVFGSFSVAPGQPPTNPRAAFNPSGDYHPVNRPTTDSERFIQFVLRVRRKSGRVIAWGYVSGVRSSYRFTYISATEKHLKFSTLKVRGASYDFDGRFLGRGDFPSQWPGQGVVMLEGTLRKFINGKKVMEINTPFLYYPGC